MDDEPGTSNETSNELHASEERQQQWTKELKLIRHHLPMSYCKNILELTQTLPKMVPLEPTNIRGKDINCLRISTV